jgi:cellulase (glycosyl hydrolase family 5)
MRASRLVLWAAAGGFVLAGCGGDGAADPVHPSDVRSELKGICDDPHSILDQTALTPDGNLVPNESVAGFAASGDLKSVNATRVRFVFNAGELPLERAFAMYDSIVDDRLSAGLPILMVLDFDTLPIPGNPSSGSCKACPASCMSVTPQSLVDGGGWSGYADQFATRAGDIANHYAGKIEAFELMNEWNGSCFSPLIPPDAYGELLAKTRAALPPGTPLVTGGLAYNGGSLDDLTNLLAAVPGLDANADAIGIHANAAWPGNPTDWKPPSQIAGYPMFADVLGALDPLGMDVWFTAWNVPDDKLGVGDELKTNKERMFEGFFRYVKDDPRLKRAYFFAWSDASWPGVGIVAAPDPKLDRGLPFVDKSYTADYRAWQNPPLTSVPTDPTAPTNPSFVRVAARKFLFPGETQPTGFVGANSSGLTHYGTSIMPAAGEEQIVQQLDAIKAFGGRVVRVFAAGNDADAQTQTARLARVLDLAQQRNLYVIAALTDFYATPFHPIGDDGAYAKDSWGANVLTDAWFKGGYKRSYVAWVDAVVIALRDHTALLAWEIGNELKNVPDAEAFVSFATSMADRIRSNDPNHLITDGMIGTVNGALRSDQTIATETLAYRLASHPNINFLTFHNYRAGVPSYDDGANDADLARQVGKPVIVEEMGYCGSLGSSVGQPSRCPSLDGNRPWLTLDKGRDWKSRGVSGYMQWGFLAPSLGNNGDGDGLYGMDKVVHGSDFDGLVDSWRTLAQEYQKP